MNRKVFNFIQYHQLFSLSSKLLVAVSGGIDSVVLLHLLHSLHYNCVVAHCNFHLRGKESDQDAEFVYHLAKNLGFKFVKTDFETQKFAQQNKISIEMAARELRYNWFEQIRQQEECGYIVIAHHVDDSIETFFLNLTRGTGIKGLSGIAPKNGLIVRPLLICSRDEIIDYAHQHHLNFCIDSTNTDNAYKRNFIRNEIIPKFRYLNPSFSTTMLNNLTILNEANEFISQTIKQHDLLKKGRDGVVKISINEIKKQSQVTLFLHELLVPYGFNRFVIKSIANSLNACSGKHFFSKSHHLVKDRCWLILERREERKQCEYIIQENDLQLSSPFGIDIIRSRKLTTISKNKNCATVDLKKLHFPLILRPWRYGDWFIPLGMRGRKKISDFFADKKYSLIDKEKAWLLLDGNGDVIWIVGERLDDRFKVTDTTTEFCIFSID